MGLLRRKADGKQVALWGEHVVGRMPSCTLCLDAIFVSAAHALIRWNGQHWELRDLGSTNGTYYDGKRVHAGQSVHVTRASSIMFGQAAETWQLVDEMPPTVAAIPLDGGTPSCLVSGLITIQADGDSVAAIYPNEDRWILEVDDSKVIVEPGQCFSFRGRDWRLECPMGTAPTSACQTPLKLDDAMLVLTVSRDEEHVRLAVEGNDLRDLGSRTCFYLALVLARRRFEDRRAGDPDAGWLSIDLLLKMVPEYGSCSHLNVEIFRLRRALCEAGLQDAAGVVERRRGQIRLGTDRFDIRREQD